MKVPSDTTSLRESLHENYLSLFQKNVCPLKLREGRKYTHEVLIFEEYFSRFFIRKQRATLA